MLNYESIYAAFEANEMTQQMRKLITKSKFPAGKLEMMFKTDHGNFLNAFLYDLKPEENLQLFKHIGVGWFCSPWNDRVDFNEAFPDGTHDYQRRMLAKLDCLPAETRQYVLDTVGNPEFPINADVTANATNPGFNPKSRVSEEKLEKIRDDFMEALDVARVTKAEVKLPAAPTKGPTVPMSFE